MLAGHAVGLLGGAASGSAYSDAAYPLRSAVLSHVHTTAESFFGRSSVLYPDLNDAYLFEISIGSNSAFLWG